ncbi:hypothetical protein ABT224_05325 [Streptomyces sp. NPDC001584]|uniref:hypothetical protein n=1 Tax=Streptomyces sp. NPDC001584 TaxID=3154521 RepID=UPI003320D0DA
MLPGPLERPAALLVVRPHLDQTGPPGHLPDHGGHVTPRDPLQHRVRQAGPEPAVAAASWGDFPAGVTAGA